MDECYKEKTVVLPQEISDREEKQEQGFSEKYLEWLATRFFALSPIQQEVLKMKYFQGMMVKDIAIELNITKFMVSYHASQSLRVLQGGRRNFWSTLVAWCCDRKGVKEFFIMNNIFRVTILFLLLSCLSFVVLQVIGIDNPLTVSEIVSETDVVRNAVKEDAVKLDILEKKGSIKKLQVPEKENDPSSQVKVADEMEKDDIKLSTSQITLEFLKMLETKQDEEGKWSDSASQYDDVGLTSLALLAFTGRGFDHEMETESKEAINKALKFILASQDKDGRFSQDVKSNSMAMLAIADLLVMSDDDELKKSLEKGHKFLIESIQENDVYENKIEACHGVLALKTCANVGILIPEVIKKNLKEWTSATLSFDSISESAIVMKIGINDEVALTEENLNYLASKKNDMSYEELYWNRLVLQQFSYHGLDEMVANDVKKAYKHSEDLNIEQLIYATLNSEVSYRYSALKENQD